MELKLDPIMENDNKKYWSKEERSNDINKTISVEQIDNGFLVTMSKDYKASNGEWKYECKKLYSKTNPLEKETPKEVTEKTTDALIGLLIESFD